MPTPDTLVGLIGCGDLGSQLAAQIVAAGMQPVVFDPAYDSSSLPAAPPSCVDPALPVPNTWESAVFVGSAEDVLLRCRVVHWAIPSAALSSLPTVRDEHLIILHDSVMHNSREAIAQRDTPTSFAFTHCLMNEKRRVIVASDTLRSAEATEHFEQLGLVPHVLTVDEHDRIMARTQGVFALLIAMGLGEELDKDFDRGYLTPSAIELRAAVHHRESHWTEQTIASILANPSLVHFVDEIRASLIREDGHNT